MKTTRVNGIELAYEVQGEGAPVLFIHGAIWADFLRPLAEEPAFGGCRRIRYHRRGYGASGGPAGGFDMQAADIVALLDQRRGGPGAPCRPFRGCDDRSRTCSLLPRPSAVPGAARAAAVRAAGSAASDFAEAAGSPGAAFEAMAGRYQAGDVAGAYDALFEPTGLDWRAAAEAAGPGAIDQGIEDAATFVEGEASALGRVELRGRARGSNRQPSALVGYQLRSNPFNPATRAFLYELFP